MTEKNSRTGLEELIQYDAENFLERELTPEELEEVYEDCIEELIWIIQESLTKVEEKRKSNNKNQNEKNKR